MPFTTTCPVDLAALRAERFDHLGNPPRELIARHVLAITALFAGDDHLAAAAAQNTLDLPMAQDPHLVIEQRVRDLSRAAERNTLYLTGRTRGDVVTEILDGEALLDDYLRIVNVTQHAAFGDPYIQVEDDAYHALLKTRADDAAEAAAHARRWARICVCGKTYGAHQTGAPWESRVVDGCAGFRHADDTPHNRLRPQVLTDAVDSWALHHARHLDRDDRKVLVDLLLKMRTQDGQDAPPLGQTLQSLVTTLT